VNLLWELVRRGDQAIGFGLTLALGDLRGSVVTWAFSLGFSECGLWV